MAGYSDTRQLIIDTLMGRPAGTEIQPEDHQTFALALNDYIRSVELVAGSGIPIDFAEPDTVPVQPNNGQAVYLSYVPRSTTKNFVNFINQSGNSISVTSSAGEVKLVTLLWNGSYWSSQIVTIDVLSDDSSVNTSNIGASDYASFSPHSNYSIGDIVRYDGKLYKFTAEHAVGTWIGTDVELASINSILISKLTELESKTDELSSSAMEFAKSLSGEIVAGRRVKNIIGKYLTREEYPTLANHPNALTSYPIALKQGETIVLNTIASGITAIALTDEQASSYTSLVKAITNVTRYQYTATEDCYVAVSGTNVLFGYSVFYGSPIEQELEDLANLIKIRLSLPTNIYASQDGGDYVVNYDGVSLSSIRIISYTNTHFITRIPLQKGKEYAFLKSVAKAYNFALTDSNNNVVDYQYCGGTSNAGVTTLGNQIHVSENELSFVCPDDNLYLWVNLYLPSSPFNLDVRDSFYMKEFYPNLDDSVNNLNKRVSILEADSEHPYANKVIYVLGDSITWLGGDNCDGTRTGYEHRGWTEYFKERIQPRVMKSYARSGATLSCYSDSQENPSANYGSPAADNILWNQVIRMKNDINNGADVPDYIIIAAGCNDAFMYETTKEEFAERHTAISGLLSDNVENTLNTNVGTSWYGTKRPAECASIAKTMRWIKDAFVSICPNAQVIICTPLQSHYSSLTTQNEVSQRIDECSQFVSWSTINQGKDCMISRLQETKGYHFTTDGTHLSVLGATMVGHILARKVLNILEI